ncbi:MAG: phosphodiesterase [Geminicoccaceae bacterium]
MLIAQISDPHIRENREPVGPVDTALCLERAVAALNAFSPAIDAVLLSGDIGNDGSDAEYAIAREILGKLSMPLFVVPGNHDGRAPMRSALGDLCPPILAGDFIQYSTDLGPVRLVAIDTLVEGKSEGGLCPARLDWLDRELANASDRPVLLMMHHPPVACGISQMDRIRLLEGAERFARIVAAHGPIERIVTGHVHRSIVRRFAGTVVQVCPGVAHQIELELDPAQPLAIRQEPPAFLLHVVDEDGSITSHDRAIGDFGRSITFREIFG